MTGLLLCGGVLVLLILLCFSWPLLSTAHNQASPPLLPEEVLAEQWQQLNHHQQQGELDAAQHQALQQELARRLLSEASSPIPPLATPYRAHGIYLGMAMVILLTATTYLALGRPDLLRQPHLPQSSDSNEAMINRLARHLVERPYDLTSWRKLGHAYYLQGNYNGAASAYARLGSAISESETVQTEYAVALSLSNLEPKPADPIPALQAALARTPHNSALQVLLAQQLLVNGKQQQAHTLLEQAYQQERDNAEHAAHIRQLLQAIDKLPQHSPH